MERIIPELIERLSHAERLERTINILQAWHKEYGTLGNIKTDSVLMYNGEPVNMKYIILKMRTRYNSGALSQNTIKMLEDMGFEWKYDRYSAIRAYYKEFGTLEGITNNTIYEYKGKQVNLTHTIYMLRQDYKNNELSQEVIDEFTKMGMVWTLKMTYDDKIAMFKQYCLDCGSLKDISKNSVYRYNGRDIRIGEIIGDFREKYANGELPKDIINQLDELGMVWSVRQRINIDKMDVFRAYFNEHGSLANIKSTTKYVYQGKEIALGIIVFNLRRDERKKSLTKEEIDELTAMGMEWGVKDNSVQLKLDILKAYVEAGNEVNDISKDTIFIYNNNPVRMHALIIRLRDLNRENKLSVDDKKMILDLGALKPKKSLKERFEVLVAHYNQYGSLENIASDEEFEYNGTVYNIGRQIMSLRARHTSNNLKQDAVEFLESMGMSWRKRDVRSSFADKLEVLEIYTQQTNKTLAEVESEEIFKFEGRNIQISKWLIMFRIAYNNGELSPRQIEALENLGIVWDGMQNRHNLHFDKQIQILEQYASEHGGTIRNAKTREIYYYNGEKFYLREMIYRLQTKYAETLTEKQVSRLNAIGMIWGGMRNHRIVVLKAYIDEVGPIKNIKITDRFEYDGYEEPIGSWMHGYRADYKMGKLSEELIKQLEDLGMVWKAKRGKKTIEQAL